MKISITSEVMGYRVRFAGAGREFDRALSLFKEMLPRRVRLFLPARRVWFVQRRAKRHLDRWIEAMQKEFRRW